MTPVSARSASTGNGPVRRTIRVRLSLRCGGGGAGHGQSQGAQGRTRQAILDSALELSADSGLASISLRPVARQVGIVPTGFYRHFDSIEELGLAILSELIVGSMLRVAEQPLHTSPSDEDDVVHVARTQLRMLVVGALYWRSRPPAGDLATTQPTSKTTLPNS